MKYVAIFAVVILIGVLGLFFLKKQFSSPGSNIQPTPTEEEVMQLDPKDQPKVSLEFSSDSHYVTVKMINVNASKVEYSIIYDAKIKSKGKVSQVNTGVTGGGTANKDSKTYESAKQLLGSESSGHITYHEEIKNGMVDLTLRDEKGRSVFKTNYSFTLTPGKVVELSSSR